MGKPIKPMLARLEAKPWNDPEWIWEVKYDGVRAIVNTGTGTIQSRSGKDKTANFPEIKPKTVKPAILDGEIVSYANGKTDFNSIQHRSTSSDLQFRTNEYPACYEVFDVLEIDGISVAMYPLADRKKLLAAVLVPDNTVHLAGASMDGEALFASAVANQLEGVIGKKLNQRYVENAREWVKVKLSQLGNFVVCGFTQGTGWRASTFGALVLGEFFHDSMRFVGEVGTGFNDRDIDEIFTSLRLTVNANCPFSPNPYTNGKQPTWVTPAMEVIVKYLEFTNDGKLRFPAFKGMVKSMGITHRYLEDTAWELAEELAEKQTGREFPELPRNVQNNIWSQAWQKCVEAEAEAAEKQIEWARERRMGI
jgi:bifunctional non-homologous end joining protein LigD